MFVLKSLLQMDPIPLSGSGRFPDSEFGMTTILWRTMRFVGYTEEPVYTWQTTVTEGQAETVMQLVIPALESNRAAGWHGMDITVTGPTPQVAARRAAMTVMRHLARTDPSAVAFSAASMFPRADPALGE